MFGFFSVKVLIISSGHLPSPPRKVSQEIDAAGSVFAPPDWAAAVGATVGAAAAGAAVGAAAAEALVGSALGAGAAGAASPPHATATNPAIAPDMPVRIARRLRNLSLKLMLSPNETHGDGARHNRSRAICDRRYTNPSWRRCDTVATGIGPRIVTPDGLRKYPHLIIVRPCNGYAN